MSQPKLAEFKAILYSFYPLGVDLLKPMDSPIMTHPVFYIVGFMSYVAWAASMIGFYWQNFISLKSAASSLLIIIQSLLSVLKMWTILYYGKNNKRLISDLEVLGAEGNQSERIELHAANRASLFIIKFYYLSVWMTVFIYLSMPFPLMAYGYIKTGQLKARLPFEGIIPYDLQNLEYYVLTYVLTITGVQFVANPATAVDSLFFWYMQNISAHFRIVGIKFESVANKFHEQNYMEFHTMIVEAISYHVRIIDLANQFNRIFAPIFFANMTFDCFLVCFLAYLLGTTTDPSSLPFAIMAACAVLSQLIIYCFGGAKLQNECEVLSNRIYAMFPWERMSAKMKGLMVLPIIRSQRVIKLAGYFFVLDRILIVWILKTAFSFAALLFAVTTKDAVVI